MNSNGKKSILNGIPSWALSLITAIISLVLLFAISALTEHAEFLGEYGDFTSYLGFFIFIWIACYFICRNNPKSIWYVPVICNVMTIISAVVEHIELNPQWIMVFAGWLISVIVAILGAEIGKRHRLR